MNACNTPPHKGEGREVGKDKDMEKLKKKQNAKECLKDRVKDKTKIRRLLRQSSLKVRDQSLQCARELRVLITIYLTLVIADGTFADAVVWVSLFLVKNKNSCYYTDLNGSIAQFGRARRSQWRGRGFDPPSIHQASSQNLRLSADRQVWGTTLGKPTTIVIEQKGWSLVSGEVERESNST